MCNHNRKFAHIFPCMYHICILPKVCVYIPMSDFNSHKKIEDQRVTQKPNIEERQTIQWPKEKETMIYKPLQIKQD